MTEISIWRARSEDEDTLIKLEEEAFGERSWGEEGIRGSFAAPEARIVLAGQLRSAPVGFAIWRDLSGEAEILTIGVAPKARRLRVGRALVDNIVETARRAGAGRLFLEVDPLNSAATALYVSVGFQRDGVRKAYYRDGADALLMSLAL
ncbi:MAG: ribosomal protein S18-alanine N-acetyltransferase [Pseudomonadota bacterium]